MTIQLCEKHADVFKKIIWYKAKAAQNDLKININSVFEDILSINRMLEHAKSITIHLGPLLTPYNFSFSIMQLKLSKSKQKTGNTRQGP